MVATAAMQAPLFRVFTKLLTATGCCSLQSQASAAGSLADKCCRIDSSNGILKRNNLQKLNIRTLNGIQNLKVSPAPEI